jgi:hypothetical protein
MLMADMPLPLILQPSINPLSALMSDGPRAAVANVPVDDLESPEPLRKGLEALAGTGASHARSSVDRHRCRCRAACTL